MNDLVTFRDDYGRHFTVRRDCEPLLRRGWSVRILWRRAHDNTALRWLRYMLSSDGCGIGGTVDEPERRWRRFGPVVVDYLPSRRHLAIELLSARQGIAFFVKQANEQGKRAADSAATLRELQRVRPSARGGSA